MSSIRTILVPVDFSAAGTAAVDFALDLAKEFDAKIHLLHCYPICAGGISPYGIVLPQGLERDVRTAAEKELWKIGEKVSAQGVEVSQTVTGEKPDSAISRAVEVVEADLIVMGTRGLSGLDHVLLGSVAERTIRTAPCPVLTVRAPRED